MIIVCKHRCQFLDKIYKPGDVVKIADDLKKHLTVAANFEYRKADEEEGNPASDAGQPSMLSKEELKLRLDALGITYKPRASQKTLHELYMSQQGE